MLWKPPPPPVEEAELKTWPLNFLESKVTATVSSRFNLKIPSCCCTQIIMKLLLISTVKQILLASGLGLIVYAGLAGEGVWKEFYQYCRGSKFVSLGSILHIVGLTLVLVFVIMSFSNAI